MKLSNLFFAALIIVSANTFAQGVDSNKASHTLAIGVPQVALLDLETSESLSISLGGTAPTETGEAVSFNDTNSDIWINYSSIVGSTTEPTRAVSVKIDGGNVPAGLELKVVAAADAGNGDGDMGTAVATPTLLSTSPSNIINGIGSAYTGDGHSNGHKLTYTLSQSATAGSYAKLDFDKSDSVTIMYTLSDN